MRGRFYLLCLTSMIAGILAGRHSNAKLLAALAACACAAGLTAAAAAGRRALVVVIPAVFLVAGSALMFGTVWRIRNGPLGALAEHRVKISVEGRAVSSPAMNGEFSSFFVEVHAFRMAGVGKKCGERVLLTTESSLEPSRFFPGVNLRASGKLAPGGRSAQWLLDHGAGCILNTSAGGLSVCPPPPDPVSRLVEAARRRISRGYRKVFAEDAAGLMEGVTLSKLDGMDAALLEDLRRCGLSHIVAVSGLHVGSAAVLTLALFGAAGAGRRGRYAAASTMALLVLAASNFRPSATRASLMAAAGYGGRLTGRRYEPLAGLSVAGILILGANPRSLYDQGLQLSFAAALGIIAVSSRTRAASRTRSLLAACAGAQLGILPLVLARGEPFPVIAIAANVLVVPVIGVLLMAGWGVAGLFPLSAWAARWAALIPAAVARYVITVASAMANVPGAGLSGTLLSAFSFLLYVAALVWVIRRAGDGRRMLAPAAACGLAVLLALVPFIPMPGTGAADRLTVLDVGEGDAILLTDRTGAAVLVDGGPDERVLERKLEERGVRKLDLAVLSHPHEDHVAGLAGVAESMPVGRILVPGVDADSYDYRRLMDTAARKRIPRSEGREGQEIRVSEAMVLEVLCAPRDQSRPPEDLNECSLVIMARLSGMTVLLCGDIGPEGIEALVGMHPDLESDVLKVPHHGARESASEALLAASRPLAAVISAGGGNRFGHPSKRCVELLEARGVTVARTDRHGDIEVSVQRGRIGLATDRR